MIGGFLAITGAAVVAACIAVLIAAASRRLPRKRRRRVGTAQSRTASFTPSACPPLPLHEVRIESVSAGNGRVLLTLLDVTRDAWVRESWVVAEGAGPGVIAKLDGWCANGSALLLYTDDHDRWQLLAPDGTTTGLSMFEVNA